MEQTREPAHVSFGRARLTYANFDREAYGAANCNYPYYIHDVTVGYNGSLCRHRV